MIIRIAAGSISGYNVSSQIVMLGNRELVYRKWLACARCLLRQYSVEVRFAVIITHGGDQELLEKEQPWHDAWGRASEERTFFTAHAIW